MTKYLNYIRIFSKPARIMRVRLQNHREIRPQFITIFIVILQNLVDIQSIKLWKPVQIVEIFAPIFVYIIRNTISTLVQILCIFAW